MTQSQHLDVNITEFIYKWMKEEDHPNFKFEGPFMCQRIIDATLSKLIDKVKINESLNIVPELTHKAIDIFKELEVLGSGAFGTVYTADLNIPGGRNRTKYFVIKYTSQLGSSNIFMVLEYFTGRLLNTLEIPNFPYTFKLFQCAELLSGFWYKLDGKKDIFNRILCRNIKEYINLAHKLRIDVDDNKNKKDNGQEMCTQIAEKIINIQNMIPDMKSFCRTRTDADYDILFNHIISERIMGKTLLQELKDASYEDYMRWLISLLFALQIAQEKYGFVHYDLHPNNIIIKDCTKLVDFSYRYRNIKYTLELEKIPVIIDFGFAHIEYKNHSFGEMETFMHKSKIFNPCVDMFGYIFGTIPTLNFPIYKKLLRILAPFFIGDDYDIAQKLLDEDKKSPNRRQLTDTEMDLFVDFRKYIQTKLITQFNQKTPYDLLMHIKKEDTVLWKSFIDEKKFGTPIKLNVTKENFNTANNLLEWLNLVGDDTPPDITDELLDLGKMLKDQYEKIKMKRTNVKEYKNFSLF